MSAPNMPIPKWKGWRKHQSHRPGLYLDCLMCESMYLANGGERRNIPSSPVPTLCPCHSGSVCGEACAQGKHHGGCARG